MRRLTLENLNTITEDDCVIVYRDDKSSLPEKPLMLMVSYANMSVDGYVIYGFMNTKNPLITIRSFQTNSKEKSIKNAIEEGYEVYAAESITRIYFTNSVKPEVYENKKSNPVAQAEEYVFSLLRKQTDFLISELALTQYPPDVLRKKTEEFITKALK